MNLAYFEEKMECLLDSCSNSHVVEYCHVDAHDIIHFIHYANASRLLTALGNSTHYHYDMHIGFSHFCIPLAFKTEGTPLGIYFDVRFVVVP